MSRRTRGISPKKKRAKVPAATPKVPAMVALVGSQAGGKAVEVKGSVVPMPHSQHVASIYHLQSRLDWCLSSWILYSRQRQGMAAVWIDLPNAVRSTQS
ncbi:uncharacterized protein BO88DRAFT_14149 [Aspergillus vadensis CBS 113365]|uniref:Uncharacterized protein n=1 Tax=Aspergillus vadensis (strain CBS 113365 / IMI 142717 / IBT 24658) TaxID=1448311 RepID=A0A319BSL5_ASPVC|nr:hypothetical protein BO88DRAFT_14149 [Aspergillus vadensis CBS 113365]PYH74469.1 hypothetical protein BO88DRAFT_14149 [Aspergillus vadensis CBS 113365]